MRGSICLKILSLVIFISLAVHNSYAEQQLEISGPETIIPLLTGETTSVEIKIKNNNQFIDTFSISIFPTSASGVIATPETTTIDVPGGEERTIKVYFTTPIETKEAFVQFFISAESTTTHASASTKVVIQVIRKTPVEISSVEINKNEFNPGEKLQLAINIVNYHPTDPYRGFLLISMEKDGSVIESKSDAFIVQPKQTTTIPYEYLFDKFAEPGTYSLKIELRNENDKVVSSKFLSFNILPISKIPENYTEKITKFGFLSFTTTIVIRNDGNTKTPPFYVDEHLPGIATGALVANIQPSEVQREGGLVKYRWYISGLAPGESITIQYHISFVNLWASLIVIAVLIYFSYRYTSTSSITKKCVYKGTITKGKEISILINVKNKTLNEMNNVVITDSVPSMLQLVEKFDTLTPKVKRVQKQTILTWDLGNLKPHEERIITYKVKPMVDIVGSITLPPAEMSYTTKRGQISSKSKSVIM